MKRVMFSLASALVLAAALAVTARAQDQYPSGTTAQQQPTTTDPSTTPTTTDQTTTSSTESMPATASPLPLMGLGGLASLAAGTWFARRRLKG